MFFLAGGIPAPEDAGRPSRPNIVLFLTDDQSWMHTGVEGEATVETPAFDRIAREGVYFPNAFVANPRCSPSRAAILTGQHPWRLGPAAQFAQPFSADVDVFPLLLEEAGYAIAWTGKGWGPGDLKNGGWEDTDPLGKAYDQILTGPPRRTQGGRQPGKMEVLKKIHYAANFEAFLDRRPRDRPFFFWCGSAHPHRPYNVASGRRSGKKLEEATVPPYLPDHQRIRIELLDYALEIDYADKHLGQMVEALEKRGLLENTLIVVTSDNGFGYPRAKGNLYDMGTRVPLAASWPVGVPAGRVSQDLVSLVDLGPTFLELAGASVPDSMSGRSLRSVLESEDSGLVDPERTQVYLAVEDEYPSRAIRTKEFLLIRNYLPEVEPPGARFLSNYEDHADYERCIQYFGKRPAVELYDVNQDPWQLNDLSRNAAYAETREQLASALSRFLRETGDERE